MFSVTVRYREPTFEARHGPRKNPFGWTFEIDAPDGATACRQALAEFEDCERHSGVNWTREIVEVVIKPSKPGNAGNA